MLKINNVSTYFTILDLDIQIKSDSIKHSVIPYMMI